MPMLRRALVWLLTLSLAWAAVAPLASAGCAAPQAAVPADASPECPCHGADGKGEAPQGCPAALCSAGCTAGPVNLVDAAQRVLRPDAAAAASREPQDALIARATPPDDPPPR